MRLGYVLLYVEDVTASVDFYERAFALKRRFIAPAEADSPPDYAEMDTGGTALGFVAHRLATANGVPYQAGSPGTAAPPAEIAFIADDVAAAFATAVGAGASAVCEPAVKPWGQTVAYVRDLDGFLVELCSEVPAA